MCFDRVFSRLTMWFVTSIPGMVMWKGYKHYGNSDAVGNKHWLQTLLEW